MESKNRSSVTHSRGTCVCDYCDYCGLKLNRHNIKAHTQNVHSVYSHLLAAYHYLLAVAKLSQAPAPAPAGWAQLALFLYSPTTPIHPHPGKFILDTSCI